MNLAQVAWVRIPKRQIVRFSARFFTPLRYIQNDIDASRERLQKTLLPGSDEN